MDHSALKFEDLTSIVSYMRSTEQCRLGLVDIGVETSKLTLYEIADMNYQADFTLRNLGAIITYFHDRANEVFAEHTICLNTHSVSEELKDGRYIHQSSKGSCDIYLGVENISSPTEIVCGFKSNGDYDRWVIVLPHKIEYKKI